MPGIHSDDAWFINTGHDGVVVVEIINSGEVPTIAVYNGRNEVVLSLTRDEARELADALQRVTAVAEKDKT